jgi:hypothetical protein
VVKSLALRAGTAREPERRWHWLKTLPRYFRKTNLTVKLNEI